MMSARAKRFQLVGSALFLGGLTACGVSDFPGEPPSVRSKTGAVLGGEASDLSSVVLVLTERSDGTSLCTGTMIAPRLLLTARHCVSNYVEGKYTCTIDGNLDRSRPRSPADAGEVGAVVEGEKVTVHLGREPDFSKPITAGLEVLALQADSICRNDIAVVVLAEAVDVPFAPVRLGAGLVKGEKVTVAGFGLNEEKKNHRRQLSGVEVLGVGPSRFLEVEGQAMPRTFVVGRSVCPGDSGGPAFSDDDGNIVGVFSLFRGACESSEVRNFFTHVAPFEELLRDGYAAVDEPFPLDEPGPPTPPEGSAGGASDDDPPTSPEPRVSRSSGCATSSRPFWNSRPDVLLGLLALVGWARRRRYAPSDAITGQGVAGSLLSPSRRTF